MAASLGEFVVETGNQGVGGNRLRVPVMRAFLGSGILSV